MTSSGKRLDLRFGVFACSVQGFDDPVQPVQQILRAIQHLLEETPELADAGINFDPETLEQLAGEVARRSELDEDQVEIVPGLIMIHHAGGGDLAQAGGETAGAWWPAGEAGDDASGADYVNLFGGGQADEVGGGEHEAEESPAAADEPPEELTARLRRLAKAGVDGGEADYGWEDSEETAEGEAGRGAVDGPAAENLFAMRDERQTGSPEDDAQDDAQDDAGERKESANLFATDADEDTAPRGEVRHLFAAPAEDEPAPDHAADRAGRDQGRPQGGGFFGAEDVPEAEAETGPEAETPPDEGYSAASIAERAGAQTVSDLMVSAAAFMVLIRGQTQFTRRDVLDVFETIPGDHEKTPEARIKGFGRAVRNGQLVMVEDGVFGLARRELEQFQRLL